MRTRGQRFERRQAGPPSPHRRGWPHHASTALRVGGAAEELRVRVDACKPVVWRAGSPDSSRAATPCISCICGCPLRTWPWRASRSGFEREGTTYPRKPSDDGSTAADTTSSRCTGRWRMRGVSTMPQDPQGTRRRRRLGPVAECTHHGIEHEVEVLACALRQKATSSWLWPSNAIESATLRRNRPLVSGSVSSRRKRNASVALRARFTPSPSSGNLRAACTNRLAGRIHSVSDQSADTA